MEPVPPLTSLVVRIARSDTGALTGTVERVRTGDKHRFESAEDLLRVVTAMITVTASPEEPDGLIAQAVQTGQAEATSEK
jgi:hypothetical protein